MDLTNPQVTLRQARIEHLEAELAKEREKVKELEDARDQLAAAQNIVDAAKNLVAVKGRHHAEIAYKRLKEAVEREV